jgi:hypothetical protein
MMSLPVDLGDPELKEWQGVSNQTVLVNGTQGAPGHGYLQQDPSHAWWDAASQRWLFIGGSYIDGSAGEEERGEYGSIPWLGFICPEPVLASRRFPQQML